MQYDWQIDYISLSDSLLEVDALATVDFSVKATNANNQVKATGGVAIVPSADVMAIKDNLPSADTNAINSILSAIGAERVEQIKSSLRAAFGDAVEPN